MAYLQKTGECIFMNYFKFLKCVRTVLTGRMVSIIYFHKNEYLKQTGMVSRIDETARILTVVQTKISFEDIYDICDENAVHRQACL